MRRPAPAAGPAALPDTTEHWLLRRSPAAWRPYVQLARLDRPIGWQLLLLPCWWGVALAGAAAHRPPDLAHLLLLLGGAVAMRGAGSTFNDVVDRDLDRQVARTRGRPVASGRVAPRAAAAFAGAQALVGLAVVLCFNRFTVLLSVASLGLVALYPFVKRVSSWPQAVLGLAFAWGALVGWSASAGALAGPPVLLYAGAVLWTMGYDTIYALQDRTDDAAVGIGSTALAFGRHVRAGVGVLYGLAAVAAGAAVATAGGGAWAWAGVAGFAAHLATQVWRVRPDDAGARALALFRSNRVAGLVLFAGLALQGSVAG